MVVSAIAVIAIVLAIVLTIAMAIVIVGVTVSVITIGIIVTNHSHRPHSSSGLKVCLGGSRGFDSLTVQPHLGGLHCVAPSLPDSPRIPAWQARGQSASARPAPLLLGSRR